MWPQDLYEGMGHGGLGVGAASHTSSPGAGSGIHTSTGAIAHELLKTLKACECAEGDGNVMDKSSRQLSAAHPLSLGIYVRTTISRHGSRSRNSTRLINKRAESVLLPAGHCWGSGTDPVSGQREAERVRQHECSGKNGITRRETGWRGAGGCGTAATSPGWHHPKLEHPTPGPKPGSSPERFPGDLGSSLALEGALSRWLGWSPPCCSPHPQPTSAPCPQQGQPVAGCTASTPWDTSPGHIPHPSRHRPLSTALPFPSPPLPTQPTLGYPRGGGVPVRPGCARRGPRCGWGSVAETVPVHNGAGVHRVCVRVPVSPPGQRLYVCERVCVCACGAGSPAGPAARGTAALYPEPPAPVPGSRRG